MENDDSNDPEDWDEIKDEDAPENLRRKWVVEEHFHKQPVPCPSCGKQVPADSLTCLFCGAVVCESGLLGKIIVWLKKLFN